MSSSFIFAQNSFVINFNFGGVELNGSIDFSAKLVEKAKSIKNPEITFSDRKIEADVSHYKKPTLIVAFSNLSFQAPKSLVQNLSLSVSSTNPFKSYNQLASTSTNWLKAGEQKVFSYEVFPMDTVNVGDLKFTFTHISINGKNFKLENNVLRFKVNITPPPLFPPDATDEELWKIASKIDNPKSYKTYIKRYPNGKSVRKAKKRKDFLIDNPLKQVITLPNTSDPVFIKNENLEWKNARKTNKIDAFQYYLKSFPKGKYAEAARSSIEKLSGDLDTQILQSAKDALKGRMIYHIEDTMTVGHVYRVRLEISSDTSSHFIEQLITTVEEYSDHPQDINDEIIQIDKTMRANLEDSSPVDNKNFYIHLFGENNEREVDLYSSKSTIWEWDVTPLKEGFYPLHFTIEIITKKEGVETQEVLPVYDSRITILSRSIFEAYKIQIISGGIISALLLVILVLFLKKKKSNQQQKNINNLLKTNPLEGAIALIENDQLKDALDFLDEHLKDKNYELFQEIILLKSRFASNDKDLHQATISQEAASNEFNKIKIATLDIIERSKIEV